MSNVDIGSSAGGSGGIAIGDAISGGTAGRILYEGAGPVLADSANLAYDGTTFTLTSPSSGSIPMKIVAAVGQTDDLLRLINSGGSTMVSFEDDGNLLISVTGSSTASPRLFGMSALNPGTAARWQFGDNLNCIQCANGKQIQMVGYHGLQLIGAHYQFASWPFAADTGSCVHIPSTQAAYITLLVDGKSGQTADLTRWRDDTGIKMAAIEADGGIYAGQGAVTLGSDGSVNCTAFYTLSLVEVGLNTGGSNISWLTINGDGVDPYLRCNNGGGVTVATISEAGAFQIYDSANDQMLEMMPGDNTIQFQVQGGGNTTIYAYETLTNTVNMSSSAVAPSAAASLGRTSNAIQWHDGTSARYLFNKIRKNSAGTIFSRAQVNLIEGSNITLTVADDAANGEIDVTIAASGGGGGLSRGQVVALMSGNYLV